MKSKLSRKFKCVNTIDGSIAVPKKKLRLNENETF